jgi:2-C-methyl-D-erythritol 4-phosphate cytidylyltransferase
VRRVRRRRDTAAIVVAAGQGRRLGRKGDKAFVNVAGRPLLLYSLLALESAPDVERTIVVVRKGAVRRCQALVKRLGLRKVEAVVAGGRRRQDSVRNGLRLAGDSQYVLVHDAARPFLSRRLVSRTMAECRRTGAAIAAEPASDTIKRVKGGRVTATVPRETLRLAQTPQAFRRELLERAFKKWPDGLDATDDAALLERAGVRVAVVPGDSLNMKVTYPSDIVLAEALLKAGKKAEGKRLAAKGVPSAKRSAGHDGGKSRKPRKPGGRA